MCRAMNFVVEANEHVENHASASARVTLSFVAVVERLSGEQDGLTFWCLLHCCSAILPPVECLILWIHLFVQEYWVLIFD